MSLEEQAGEMGFPEVQRIVGEARQGRARARQQEANGRIVQQLSPLQAKMKCKNFLATLLRLVKAQPEGVARNVRGLIKGLIDGHVEPELFTTKLQKELNSSPQPCLAPFLKKSLPYLQQSLAMRELTIESDVPLDTLQNAEQAVGSSPSAPTISSAEVEELKKKQEKLVQAAIKENEEIMQRVLSKNEERLEELKRENLKREMILTQENDEIVKRQKMVLEESLANLLSGNDAQLAELIAKKQKQEERNQPAAPDCPVCFDEMVPP